MEKKNKLYYFESHEEIRSYMANGFPSRVYLTTRRATIVKGEQVVHPRNIGPRDCYGEKMHQWEIDDGRIEDPGMIISPTVIGQIEDFMPQEYATRHDFRRETIETDKLLEGFYEAGDMLAKRMKVTEDEHRTAFTAKELITPADKGGAKTVGPDESEQEVLYMVVTETSRYQIPSSQLFEMIEAMERAMGVGPAKRRRFAIENEAAKREVIVRMTFSADKYLSKMKQCCSKNELKSTMQQPAIEIKTGIMVATDGHVLAAHKTLDFQSEVFDTPQFDKVLLPIEVTQMKGTVTVEVIENKTPTGVELSITARDEKGKQGVVKQISRYPNWRSVIPCNVGKGINVDAPVWVKAVKQVLPHVSKASGLMRLDAERGAKVIKFCGEDYDFSQAATVNVTVNGVVATGLWVGVNTSAFLRMLDFAPTVMHFTDQSRAMLLHNNETLLICMPMQLNDSPDTPRGPGKDDMEKFDLGKWCSKVVEAKAKAASKREKKDACISSSEREQARHDSGNTKTKTKKSVKKTTDKTDRTDNPAAIDLAERLRQALLARLAA